TDTDLAAGFGEWPMWFEPGPARPMAGGRPLPLSAFAGQRVHAVAGLGDPERFLAILRGHGIAVVPHAFGDHHRYVAEDLRCGSALPVRRTEEGAVECRAAANDRGFGGGSDARLPDAFWLALLDRLGPRSSASA